MGVRIQELPATSGIKKEDVLIVEDGQGTKKGTVQQLDETLGVSQLKEDLVDITTSKENLYNSDDELNEYTVNFTAGTNLINDVYPLSSYNLSPLILVEPNTEYYFVPTNQIGQQTIKAIFGDKNALCVGNTNMILVGGEQYTVYKVTTPTNAYTLRLRLPNSVHGSMFLLPKDYNGELFPYGTHLEVKGMSELREDVETSKTKISELEKDNRKLYLPNNIYCRKNVQFEIPYSSIVYAFDLNSIYFKATLNDGISKCFMDRYIRTIGVSGGETFYLVDSKTDNVLDTKVVNLKCVDTSSIVKPSTQKNILVIGDSFIQNGTIADDFKDATDYLELNFNYIGTRTTTKGTKHEGNGGWKVYDYINNPTVVVSDVTYDNKLFNNGSFDIRNYVETICNASGLDYCIIHLGVNDLLGGRTNSQIATDMTNFINAIKLVYPNCKFIVDGLVIPSRDNTNIYNPVMQALKIFEYNNEIETTIDSLENAYYSPVLTTFNEKYAYPYELMSPFKGSTETRKIITDYLHPYECGYHMISEQSINCFLFNCMMN